MKPPDTEFQLDSGRKKDKKKPRSEIAGMDIESTLSGIRAPHLAHGDTPEYGCGSTTIDPIHGGPHAQTHARHEVPEVRPYRNRIHRLRGSES